LGLQALEASGGQMLRRIIGTTSLAVIVLLGIAPDRALANGTETLGPLPAGFTISTGTGIIAKGVGLWAGPGHPGFINLFVPRNAQVKQVLLYWSGFFQNDRSGRAGNLRRLDPAPHTTSGSGW
jgi:hypothetical protein